MLKIAVAGAGGRMGKELVSAINIDPELTLSTSLLRPTAEPAKKPKSFVADVFIDFSTAAAVEQHVTQCQQAACPMVIGVTGLSADQYQVLVNAAKDIPIVYSANMSIGVNLCCKLLELCGAVLDQSWQVAIQDTHHKHKKDAPSGTSLQLAKALASPQLQANIQYNSVRAGDVVGDHSVTFFSTGERIEITHRASDRAIYAHGALMAAKWIVDKKPGLYSMRDILTILV